MRLSFHSHLSKKQALVRAFFGASLLAISPVVSWAQTTSYTTSQNFEALNAGGNLRFTFDGPGGYFASQSPDNYSPSGSNLYSEGRQAFGVETTPASNNNLSSTQVNFRNVRLTNSATLTFRLAVFATNTNGNSGNGGLDGNGSIVVSINPDSAASPTKGYKDVLRIQGSGNGNGAYWSFTNNIATNPGNIPATATANYEDPKLEPYTVNSLLNTHYTRVQVGIPTTISQAKIRITLTASAKTIILIDNVVLSSSSPLPVELTRFSGEAQEKSVALHWITASEKNSDYFEVQRSSNGESFTAIGKVQGEGTTSSISNYLFNDRAPLAGLAYYRLRQVDLDGTETYSPVTAVQWAGKLVASFYPNPSANNITLTGSEGLMYYRIYSVKGQQVAMGEAENGSTVDLTKVPAGIYLLELSGGGQRSVQRFVRQ